MKNVSKNCISESSEKYQLCTVAFLKWLRIRCKQAFLDRRVSYVDCQGKVGRGNEPKTCLNFIEWGLMWTAAMYQ